MDDRIGCNTLYPHGRLTDAATQFDVAAHAASLNLIADAGFDGCEFSHYEHLAEEDCVRVGDECRALGLEPWSAHSWVVLPKETSRVDEALPRLRRAIEGAAALGASVMVVHAESWGASPGEDARRERRLALETCLVGLEPYAITLGVKIALENCSDGDDLRFLIRTVRELALPCIGFTIDTGHAVLRGIDPAEAVSWMGDLLATTHLQDNDGARDDHLPPGCGSTVDWPRVLGALQKASYDGVYMVEISDCPAGREPDAAGDMQRAHDNLRSLLNHVR